MKLEVTRLNLGMWEVLEDFKVYPLTIKKWITIPKGFQFVGASIPTVLHWLINPPDIIEEACVHDFLYKVKTYSRHITDKIFREYLRRYGQPEWKVKLIYSVVKTLGWMYWNKSKGKKNVG